MSDVPIVERRMAEKTKPVVTRNMLLEELAKSIVPLGRLEGEFTLEEIRQTTAFSGMGKTACRVVLADAIKRGEIERRIAKTEGHQRVLYRKVACK